MQYKYVFLDVNGTLTRTENTWLEFTELLGGDRLEHQKIFNDMSNGLIDYPLAKDLLISLWKRTGNATRQKMLNAFELVELKKECGEIIEYFNDIGVEPILLSGAIDLFVESVANRLGIKRYIANSKLSFNENGDLLDFEYHTNQSARKLFEFQSFCENNTIDINTCVMIGDGSSDSDVFKLIPHKILVVSENNTEDLSKEVDNKVSNLLEIKKYI